MTCFVQCLLKAVRIPFRPVLTDEQLGLKVPRLTLKEAMSCVGARNWRAQKGTLLEACAVRVPCRGNATRGISCFLSNGCSAWAGKQSLACSVEAGGRQEVWQTQPMFLNAGHGLFGIDG